MTIANSKFDSAEMSREINDPKCENVLRGQQKHWECSMNYFTSLLSLLLILGMANITSADPPRKSRKSYPLVYGATGRPYGPTQSHYQYQLRYGRPWNGGGSSFHSGVNGSRIYSGRSSVNIYTPGLNFYSPYAYPEYSPIYGLNRPYFATPNLVYPGPVYPQYGTYGLFGDIPGVPTINHVPYQNGANGQTMIGRGFQPNPFQAQNPQQFNNQIEPTPIVDQSTPAQRERSLRERVLGDEAFAKTDYRRAGEHYRDAMNLAPDQADPRYRYALSLAARSRFDEAVDQLKIATELDMDWPSQGVTLDQLYGLHDPNDWMKRDEKNRIKTRIAEWTNRDVRDPNRLFLLAAVMMLDGDVRAKGLLETAVQLNGVERHLVAFLRPLVDESSTAGNEPVPTPVVSPRVFEPGKKLQPGFVPPAPEAGDRGEIVGEERARRVFEKTPSLIPAQPEDLNKDLPTPAFPSPEPPANGPLLPPRAE
ncbi:hypothetical protein OAH05_01115 [bacterium]|nr:hypothetical protein [Planctomicrobium sp.]MDB4802505.1 hypothetical protein [bacterium]